MFDKKNTPTFATPTEISRRLDFEHCKSSNNFPTGKIFFKKLQIFSNFGKFLYICNREARQESMKVLLSKEAHRFVMEQPEEVRQKIDANIRRVENGIISASLFKKLKGTDIWELRTQHEGMAYRILAFWDKTQRSLVIATHGFFKKTQKTPPKEIAKAERIMNEYYNTK